jgi:two-component system phosphate regulon sensor histidine kinase PhoR
MTIFKKSILTMGAAALIFSVVFVIVILLLMNSLYYEINTSGLKNTAVTLMEVMGKDNITQILKSNVPHEVNLPLKTSAPYRLTLIAPSGYVVWDSLVTEGLANHIDREEVRAALDGKESGSRRDSVSTGMKQIYYALPVYDSGGVAGVFRLSLIVPDFKTRISPVIFPFIIFVILMVASVFLAVFAFSRSLSYSINRLVLFTQEGTSLLSGREGEKKVSAEYKSLENAIRAMTIELNYQLNQAVAESNRLEAILNGMSEAVFAMNSGLRLHLVNPRARELFNLGSRDISEMSLLEATRSAELEDAAKKAITKKAALETELVFRSGVERHFQVFVSPLSDAQNGESRGVVLVLQEVTRIVKLEKIRKDFVANVSHELRTPIQLIKGFSETLQDTFASSEKEKDKQIIHFIDIINKNAGVMENLTNDLLILADLENNSSLIREKEELKIAALIDEVVSSIEHKAKRKEIEVIVNCNENLTANILGSFIVQALINLTDNGIKYSPNKSKIWVNAYQEKNDIVLEVKDKGIGISGEHLEHIFERFYRVDRARSREAGGTGLGLSIVRHIALLHNGKTEVESRTNEGSTFRIRIPRN